MEDHHRRVIKAMQRHAPGMQATLVRERKHVVVDFALNGKTYRAVMSKSPRDVDHLLRTTTAEICKAFELPKINF